MSESQWTTDTLKALIDVELRRLNDLSIENDNRIMRVWDQTQKNQDKFEETVAARFKQVNEFRSALDDLGKQMATRREMETAVGALATRLDDQQKQLGELRSRLDVGPPQLEQLEAYHYQQQGRQQGVGVSATVLAAISGIAIAAITLIVTVYLATH